jgi:Protein of unknown function (DUF2911)
MKKSILILIASIGFFNSIYAQKPVASPAETIKGKIGAANITINYGSPSVKGRVIWGELVPFDKVWRTGANDATTFETDKDLLIEGAKLPAGKYSFFIIPNEKECTLIFNTDSKQWGAYKYKEKNDKLRVKVSPEKKAERVEKMIFNIIDSKVVLSWDVWDIGFKVSN